MERFSVDVFWVASARHIETEGWLLKKRAWVLALCLLVGALSSACEGTPTPTAVVCYNDLTAIGAIRAVVRTGRSVPEDISLVGFDDIELAQWIDPPLTTIAQPKQEMGAWAFARLAIPEDGAGRDARTGTVRLPTSLVVRRSTAPPRRRPST